MWHDRSCECRLRWLVQMNTKLSLCLLRKVPSLGCFSSGCSDDQKQIFTEVAQGGIISVTGMDLASGDMICSTGQVGLWNQVHHMHSRFLVVPN